MVGYKTIMIHLSAESNPFRC